ncbi:MAG: T9SS type A sorting domain-containing protein [Saprospiraceae bacterium]
MTSRLILSLAFLYILKADSAAQRIDVSFVFDGVMREFIISKPSGAVPSGGYPIVMVLHGTTGDGEKFYNISGWKELGEKEKILTIYPSSLSFCVIGDLGFKVNQTKWNNGDLQTVKCPNLNQDFKDDVKFLKKIIDTVQRKFNTDSKRIFLTGFSNGSVMSGKMIVEASDVFTAIASSAGVLHPLDSGKVKRYIPAWQTLGTNDPNIYKINNGNYLPFNDSLKLFILGFAYPYLNCLNLDTVYTVVKSTNVYTFQFKKTKSATQNNFFNYSFMNGLDHQYPNGENYPVSDPLLFWEFFKQAAALTTSVENISIPLHTIRVFPNPSKDMITIELPPTFKNEVHLEVFNLLGEKVWDQKNIQTTQHITLHKFQLGSGVFTAIWSSEKNKAIAKLIFD